MPLYTVIDFETTSKYAQVAYPLSLSYITFEGRKFLDPIDSGTLFFYEEGVDIPEDSFRIHGLSVEFMSQFIDQYRNNCRKLYKIIQRGNLIGQNIKQYDIVVANQLFNREGYRELNIQNLYDTRWMLGQSCSQEKMLKAFDIDEDTVKMYWEMLYPNSVFQADGVAAHNSEFDTTGTLLLFMRGVNSGKFTIY